MKPLKIGKIAFPVAAILVLIFGSLQSAHAGAIITVVNLDNPGEGFNDASAPDPDSTAGGNTGATLGEQRLIAFQYAADIWGEIVDSNVEIKAGANFDPLSCGPTSAVLGSAGPTTVHRDFPGAPESNTWYAQALANSLAGTDLSTNEDISATFNSAIGTTCSFPNVWYYGLDGNPPGNNLDFVSVVLHELAHSLGFLTFVSLTSGARLLGYDDAFMLHLEDHSTGKLYPEMTNGERVTASTDAGDLHWVGPSVVADGTILTSGRHPSGHVEMYAPTIQQPGSSVSHFSTSLFPDQLMEPSYTGPTRDVGLARALIEDIGWELDPDFSGCATFQPGPDWCRDCGPCPEGQGDCDGDGQCQAGLTCAQDVGANYGMPANYDVCEQPGGPCATFQPGPDWCRDCGPCSEGQGDCDNDGECQSGLTCVQVPGTDTCQSSPPVCPHPVGHLDYCRDCGPCGAGQGDCDNNSECENGLECVQVPGTDTCQASSPVCPHPVGHLDYCRDCGPCAAGEGDCDIDSECEAGLTCVQVPGTDNCQSSTPVCPHPAGHLDYCRDCGPCAAGQGDCDNDSECQSGLTCVQVPGTDACCPHPLGHLDYCRDCGPCAAGQGDCDNDGECQSGLTCVQVTGTDTCQ